MRLRGPSLAAAWRRGWSGQVGSRERSRKAATARGGGGGDTAFLPTRPLSPDDARLPRAFPQPQAAGASRARRPSLSPARPVRLRPSLRLPHVCPEPRCPVFFLLCGPPGAPGLALLPPGLAEAGLPWLVATILFNTHSFRPVARCQAKGLGLLVDEPGDTAHPAPAPSGAGRVAHCRPAPPRELGKAEACVRGAPYGPWDSTWRYVVLRT